MTRVPPADEYQEWLDLAEAVMTFMRSSGCIRSVDRNLWFFTSHAADQLAAFLHQELREVEDR